MGNRNIVNGLALIGAILVIVGVTFAASSALADEVKVARAPAGATDVEAEFEKTEVERANRDAANEAVAGLAEDNRLDLEIRLADRTSIPIARSL